MALRTDDIDNLKEEAQQLRKRISEERQKLCDAECEFLTF